MEKDPKRIIEAALFMSSRPLGAQELGKVVGVAALGYVENELKKLQKEYDDRGSALVVACEEGKYIMRIRPEYVNYVKEFAKEGEISRHALKTLAYVAKFEGMKKSELCRKLGSTIYSDVQELVEKGFVSQKKQGRSTLLSTTPKFKEYFGQ